MYSIDFSNLKKGIKYYLIAIVVSILFIAVISMVFINRQHKINSLDASVRAYKVEVQSYEDDNTTMYSPTYYYIVNNTKYSCVGNASTSDPRNTLKKIYYSTAEPSVCFIEGYKSDIIFIILGILVLLLFMLLLIFRMLKLIKKIKIIEELNTKGKLVKGLPYSLENTGEVIMNHSIQRLVVNYKLPDGRLITLYSDSRYDKKEPSPNGKVDLVIDPENYNNYFIDYEINRLSGNLDGDYYNDTNENNK